MRAAAARAPPGRWVARGILASQVGLAFAWPRFSRPLGASLGTKRAARGRVDGLVAVIPADAIARRRIAAQDLLNDVLSGQRPPTASPGAAFPASATLKLPILWCVLG